MTESFYGIYAFSEGQLTECLADNMTLEEAMLEIAEYDQYCRDRDIVREQSFKIVKTSHEIIE